MRELSTIFFVLFSLAIMTGIMFWAYETWNNTPKYESTFRQSQGVAVRRQHKEQQKKKSQDVYHRTREADIEKYHGDRYATY